MPKAQRTEIFDVEVGKLYSVITDFARTHEFVDGVSEVEVLEVSSASARVKYFLNIIKKFSYILSLTMQAPNHIEWELESGDLFKKNSGSWDLKDLGDGSSEVTYNVDLDFKGFAPKMIINKLVEGNLPSMMKAYSKEAKKL